MKLKISHFARNDKPGKKNGFFEILRRFPEINIRESLPEQLPEFVEGRRKAIIVIFFDTSASSGNTSASSVQAGIIFFGNHLIKAENVNIKYQDS